MLKGILPKVLQDDIYPDFKVFEGKQDLDKRLPRILKAWCVPHCCFVIIRDQDSGDCYAIKQKLIDLCRAAGREDVLVRIACHELESFYLGDLAAVEEGLGIAGLVKMQNNRKYRSPDRLGSPSRELDRLTSGRYEKVAGSRAIAPHIRIDDNKSHSFKNLVSGIRKLVGAS
jgi:hypothetical protein